MELARALYLGLCWWAKWLPMMPLDNRAINKAQDIEDKYRKGRCTFMVANVALDIARWRTFTAAPVAPHVPT